MFYLFFNLSYIPSLFLRYLIKLILNYLFKVFLFELVVELDLNILIES